MDNIEDFHKKYNSTWVQYRGKEGLSPALVESVSIDELRVYVRSQEEGVVSINYDAKLEDKLDVSTPPTGFFNYNGHALVLFRTPHRQWRCGLCSDNHEIYNPFRKLLNEGIYRCSFGGKTIAALFKPCYVANPEDARSRFSNAVHSVALSRRLMISKSPLEQTSYPLVWYGCTPCGFIRGSKFVIEDEVFQQEVEDELRHMGCEQWIF